MSSSFGAGGVLRMNQYIQSPSGNYFFGIYPEAVGIQPMIYTTPTAYTGMLGVFAGTPSNPQGVSLVMANDVNAVTLDAHGTLSASKNGATTYTAISNAGPSFVVMQDDGNLCVYSGDAAHQGAFKWGSIQQGGKRSGFGGMPPQPVRMDLVVNTSVGGCSYSIQWNGGETDRLSINGSFSVASYQGLKGIDCWLRAHDSMLGNHDSGDNFNFGDPNVVYNLSGGPFSLSWDRKS